MPIPTRQELAVFRIRLPIPRVNVVKRGMFTPSLPTLPKPKARPKRRPKPSR